MTDADVPGTLVPREQPREEARLRGLDGLFDQIIHWGGRQRVPFLLSVKSNCQPFDLLRQILDGVPLLDVHLAQMIDLTVRPFQRLT